jgi:MFS family permease
MQQRSVGQGWHSLIKWQWIPILSILLGGVLVQSINVLMLATVLPSIVAELGGVAMLSWPTTAYLASSIVAASCAGMLANAAGARIVYCAGVTALVLGHCFARWRPRWAGSWLAGLSKDLAADWKPLSPTCSCMGRFRSHSGRGRSR